MTRVADSPSTGVIGRPAPAGYLDRIHPRCV